jgi:pyrophosphatase PpaX
VEAFEADRVEPFPGVAERLARLAANGFRLGLVTGGYRDVVTPQLERTGLGDLLPVRVFGDETEVRKPDPEPLRLGLDRLGALADRAAYVGDAPDDMRMAAAVGAHGVGVVSVVADAATLRVAGARETTESTVAWIDAILAAADGDGR